MGFSVERLTRKIKAIAVLNNYVAKNIEQKSIIISSKLCAAVLETYRKDYNTNKIDFVDDLKKLLKKYSGKWSPAELARELLRENEKVVGKMKRGGRFCPG